MISIQSFYNSLAPLYFTIDFFLKPQRKILLQELEKLPSSKILEIGASSTCYSKTNQVTVIDLSEKMLQQACKKNTIHQYLVMDGENTNFENNFFDCIILSHVLSVTPNPNLMISEAQRILKPHGKIFILNHFTPNTPLQYLDKSFQLISSLFHFKSYFKINTLVALKKLKKENHISIGFFNYYMLLIYSKE